MGNNSILVRICREGYTAILQTYDRIHGRSAPYRVHVVILRVSQAFADILCRLFDFFGMAPDEPQKQSIDKDK